MGPKAKSETAKVKRVQVIDMGTGNQDAKKILDRASKLISSKEQKSIEEAFRLLSDQCNRDAQHSKAFYYRGQCYNLMGDFQRALYDFSVAIKISKDNKEGPEAIALHYNYAGVQHYELGQLDEALKHYDLALMNDKNIGYFWYNRGLVKSRLDQVKDAVEDYKEAISKLSEPDYLYQAHFNQGICLRRLGPEYLDKSIEHLKKAVEMKNDRASAHNNLGLSYFEKGEFEDALIHYHKAIGLEATAVHFNNKGLANYHINRQEDAKKDFDDAVQKDPNDPTIYFNRGNVFLNWQPDQNFTAAHRDYDTALDIAPKNAKLWHSKGLAYQGEAEAILQATGLQDNQGLNKASIEMFQQALNLQENFVSSRFHLGLMYHKTNQFQEALQCFSKVLKKIPNDKTVFIARGVVYQDMGNHQLAINDFNKSIEIDPELSEGYFRRGFSKLYSKQFHEGIKDFMLSQRYESLDEDKKNHGIPDGLGCCYHALKEMDKALEYYHDAVQGDTQNTEFLMHRAQCYFDLSEYTNSQKDLNLALEIKEDDPQVHYRLGLAFYADADYKQCVRALKTALKNKPFFSYEADIFYHIGLAYCNQEKFEKAIYPFTRCIELNPSEISFIHERAKAFQMIEDHENAVADFDVLIKKNPKNAHAYFRRAFSQKSLKRYGEAADDFEQAKALDPLNPKMVVNYKKLKGVSCIVLCKPGQEKVF